MGAVIGAVYVVGVIATVAVGRYRVGLSQRGRLDGSTALRSMPWVAVSSASMLLWPVFLAVWLARGRPETPWETQTSPRDGALVIRRRADR